MEQQLKRAQDEILELKDRLQSAKSGTEDQIRELKQYIKCLESDLQEARVQSAITRSMSRASGQDEEEDVPAVADGRNLDSETAAKSSQSVSRVSSFAWRLICVVVVLLQSVVSPEVGELQERLKDSLMERDLLEDQVKCMREDLENFRCQTKIVSWDCFFAPLVVVVALNF